MRANAGKDQPPASTSLMRNVWIALACLFMIAALSAWAHDFISLTGERTVYTADCRQGTWVGNRCTGDIVAGERYKFRALRAHGEVIFWTACSAEPSGKFTGCNVESGRNWSCPPSADAARTITQSMAHGQPVPGPQHRTRAFRSVSKLRWLALRQGLTFGSTANE
jgi:hypothetical protein